ncbi:MAG: M56 family metallopeptidase [Clostridiales bacterium]|jgi:beta-lactamase regulating signal transducer with metallopeptidase domain|nr:M56 family metallopeptidase [Clostridiales bacterium]
MTQTILTASISGALLILILLAARSIFQEKANPRWQYAVWGIVLIRLLLPIQIPINVNMPHMDSPAYTAAINMILPDVSTSLTTMLATSEAGHNPSVPQHAKDNKGANFEQILLMVWVAGMILTASYLFYVNLRFYRKLSSIKPEPRVIDLYNSFCLDWGIKRVPKLILSSEASSPCLAGVIKPRLILTRDAVKDETILRHVLLHELCHYKRRDNIFLLLRNIALVLHWFNPVVWLGVRVSAIDCELSCDAQVLQGIGDKEEYGESILKLSSGASNCNLIQPSLSIRSSKNLLKRRINFIITRPVLRIPCVAAAALMIVIFLMTACTLAGEQPSPEMIAYTTNPSAVTTEKTDSPDNEPDTSPISFFKGKDTMDMDIVRLLVKKLVSEKDIIEYFSPDRTEEYKIHEQAPNDALALLSASTYELEGNHEFCISSYVYPGQETILLASRLGLESEIIEDNGITLPCRLETLEAYLDACQKGEAYQVITKMSPDGLKFAETRYHNQQDRDTPRLKVYQDGQETAIPVTSFAPVRWSPDSKYLQVSLTGLLQLSEDTPEKNLVVLYNSETGACDYVITYEELLAEATKLGIDVDERYYAPNIANWAPDSRTFSLLCEFNLPNSDDGDAISFNIIFDVAENRIISSELI